MRRRLAAIAWIVLAALPAAAQELRLRVDPEASSVRFDLAATLHTVHGSLRLRPGEITVDPGTRELGGSVVVDATSAETGNAKRDRKMHAEVLESARFPRMTFTPRGFEGELRLAGESRVDLLGTLELHGTEHALRVPAVVRVEGERLLARSEFPVPYVDWGLEDPSTMLLRVGKSAQVTVEIVAQRVSGP